MACEIAVTARWPGSALEQLEERYTVRVRDETAPLDEGGLIEHIGDADAVLTQLADPVTEAVLDACEELRVVANVAVGFNNIDLEAARRRGIRVTNTPDVLTEATADLAWSLILAVVRRVVEGDALVRRGRFDGWRPDLLLGRDLTGATLGVVGFGRIGRAVARRGRAFGMRLLAHDPRAGSEPGVRFVDLAELLESSDIVSLHCPLTDDTRGLIGADELDRMPLGAYLINTARGPIVDEAALVSALNRGHLGGAGLDVYEHEPDVHPGLVDREDVVLLPHIGSATIETRSAMLELAVDNATAVLEGREPPTAVV